MLLPKCSMEDGGVSKGASRREVLALAGVTVAAAGADDGLRADERRLYEVEVDAEMSKAEEDTVVPGSEFTCAGTEPCVVVVLVFFVVVTARGASFVRLLRLRLDACDCDGRAAGLGSLSGSG